MISVLAVYENGVLRPAEPLDLAEGQRVQVTISESTSGDGLLSDEQIVRRLREAKSIAEWVEVTKSLPSDDGGYDIVQALNQNRIRSGERPLLPEKTEMP